MQRLPRLVERLTGTCCLAVSLASLLLCNSGAAFAAPTSTLRFEQVSALGSEQASTLSMLQDRRGFIWIGTYNKGLYRFDGYQTNAYRHSSTDPRSLPDDRVAAIFEDRAGRIWIGTQDGLVRYDPQTDNFTRFVSDSPLSTGRIIKAIIDDGAGGMWLATWGGLQHFNPDLGTFRRYEHDQAQAGSVASDDVNAIARDDHGGLWIATWPGGLDYLPAGAHSFLHFRVDRTDAPDAKLNIVRALHFDARGVLWIGTETGIVQWRAGSDWASRRRIDSPASRVTQIYADQAGTVWAATLSAGLLHWNHTDAAPVQFRRRGNDPFSLPSDHVRALLHDRSGMLWVASDSAGIALANLNSQGFTRLIPNDAESVDLEPDNFLHSIAGAPDGMLWLGGNAGLTLFDPRRGNVVRRLRASAGRAARLSSDIAYCLLQQPGGPLWVGTAAGLNRVDAGRGEVDVVHFGSVANDYINTIAPGADGVLWLGTGGSLIRYEPASGAARVYKHDARARGSRSAKSTTAIWQDRQGRVWAGSGRTGGGLDLLDPVVGTFRNFRHDPAKPDSVSNDNIVSLFEDARGRIWVGTASGLDELISGADGGIAFRHVDSLGRLRVEAIRSDRAGLLWLSSDDSLVRYDPATGTVSRYSGVDGLTEGYTGAAYRAVDGTLYFGGSKGMTAVDPDHVRTVASAPMVAITDVIVANRSVRESSLPPAVRIDGPITAPTALTLGPGQAMFAIEFAVFDFMQSAQNQYLYRLQGFDADWLPADAAHRRATYTNLDPGNYRFEVRGRNSAGIWSTNTATLMIAILPPFWKSSWFRLLVLLLSCCLIVGAYRWRVARLHRHTALLESQVARRLTQLQMQQQENRETNARLEAILQNAADAILTTDQHWDIESCNEAGLRIYGWHRAELLGTAFGALTDDREQARRQLDAAKASLRSQRQVDLEMYHQRADASRFAAELAVRTFLAGGQTKFIIVVRDISERKRVERLKAEFISTVSHEFRTPLTAIRGGLGLVANGVAGAVPQPVQNLVQIALRSAERLARMINDLLDVQKMESGMMDFSFHLLPLSQLLADTVEAHQPYAVPYQVSLLIEGPLPALAVRVDVDRFSQVMGNLLSNACKYSPAGAQVRVRARVLDERWVRIEVADCGPGIPGTFQDRIFEKFSQADASDARAKSGSGLGLSIARELTEKMGGKIGFTTGAGAGTVFYVDLPSLELPG